MNRFRFRLEAALRVRRRLEEQAQIELAQKQRHLAEEEAGLAELRAERRRLDDRRAELQRRPGDVSALCDADRYGDAIERAAQTQQERVAAAAAAVTACLEALQRRRADREVLERLRERRLEEYRYEALSAEQKLLDEAAVLRWTPGED